VQAPAKSALKLILGDKNILTLALTSCFFEGTLFLFIFFKFPALKLCHELSGSTAGKIPMAITTSCSELTLVTRVTFRTDLCDTNVLHDVWLHAVQQHL
jgi:hypothetical protein